MKFSSEFIYFYLFSIQAKLKVNEYEDALTDFNTVLKYDADNKAAKNHIIMCTKKMKEYKAKEKQLYANIFNKYSMETAKVS